MIDQLIHIDHEVFYLINSGWKNALFDFFMPLWRNKYFWAPLYLFLIVFFFANYNKYGWIMVLFAVITIVLSDQFSSGIMKPLFHRLRPCHNDFIDPINLMVRCGGKWSFTSSHATNHFALGAFVSFMLYKPYRMILLWAFLWAASVSYAQVYVGVHFPLDILVGGSIGMMIGSLTANVCKKMVTRIYPDAPLKI